jgi:hypothetical protein
MRLLVLKVLARELDKPLDCRIHHRLRGMLAGEFFDAMHCQDQLLVFDVHLGDAERKTGRPLQ